MYYLYFAFFPSFVDPRTLSNRYGVKFLLYHDFLAKWKLFAVSSFKLCCRLYISQLTPAPLLLTRHASRTRGHRSFNNNTDRTVKPFLLRRQRRALSGGDYDCYSTVRRRRQLHPLLLPPTFFAPLPPPALHVYCTKGYTYLVCRPVDVLPQPPGPAASTVP
jgi:hypothetical protein